MNAIIKGIAQARKDGEAVTLGMIVALVIATSIGVCGVFGFWAIAPYAVGVIAGVLGEAVIVHMQRYL
jgi:hypothetical protein